MKQQTLPTSIEYGKLVEEKTELLTDYYSLRKSFDEKIMQQPHLSQFIPCVEDNGVWKPIEAYQKTEAEIFADENSVCRVISKAESKYYTALSKVLFSGWRLKYASEFFIGIECDEYALEFNVSDGKLSCNENFEHLTTLNLPLTETGVIEFNLKF